MKQNHESENKEKVSNKIKVEGNPQDPLNFSFGEHQSAYFNKFTIQESGPKNSNSTIPQNELVLIETPTYIYSNNKSKSAKHKNEEILIE